MAVQGMVSSFAALHMLLLCGAPAIAQPAADRRSAPPYDARAAAAANARGEESSPRATGDLQLRLSSRFVFAPGAMQTRIRVPQHPDNRLLRVTLDSQDYYSSSDVALDGAAAALNHFLMWKALPAGRYDVIVTVLGADGPRQHHRQPFEVFGSRPAR